MGLKSLYLGVEMAIFLRGALPRTPLGAAGPQTPELGRNGPKAPS